MRYHTRPLDVERNCSGDEGRPDAVDHEGQGGQEGREEVIADEGEQELSVDREHEEVAVS